MTVYWLEQTEGDVPVDDIWLSARELARLNTMRFVKRRNEWRLGRWTTKQAVAQRLGIAATPQAFAQIEIVNAQSGAPETLFLGKSAGVSVSLSHRSGVAVCAIADHGLEIGCDLETTEQRCEAFLSDYFTAREQALAAEAQAADQAVIVALMWSAKESALKALRIGLRMDSRSLDVSLERRSSDPLDHCNSGEWRPFRVECTSGKVFPGWWQLKGSLVRTVAADRPIPAPVEFSHFPAARCA